MATLSFEGESHGEIVQKVRRWLASTEGAAEGHISTTDAVTQGAELTKEALRIIASVAPEPIAQNDLVKALTSAGYKATDTTKDAIIDGLDSVQEMTGGSVVRTAQRTGKNLAWQMNSTVARQILKALSPR